MKKIFNKVLVAIIAVVIALGCTACGQIGQKKDKGANIVQFYVWDSGYGTEWVQEIVDEYNAMKTGYTVELDTHINMTTITATLGSGDLNPYDLYLTGLESWANTIPDMADLSDVIEATYGNEGVTIGSKMNPAFIDRNTIDGKLTGLPLGSSATGIFYNADIFEELSIELPNTTDELSDVVWDIQGAALKVKDVYPSSSDATVIRPWVHFGDSNNGYWKYVYEIWAGQYFGVADYEDFIQLKNENGVDQLNAYLGLNADGSENKEKDARYKVLKYLEEINTTETVHIRSNEFNHTQMQTAFIENQAAMVINGSWMKNEMKMGNNVNSFKFMRTPIFSDCVEKLDYRTSSDGFMPDALLSDIVTCIDEGKTYEETKTAVGDNTLSQDDFDTIVILRGMGYGSIGEAGQLVFAPDYSNSLEATKDFLKYMYSDAGAQAWMDSQRTPFGVKLLDETLVDKSSWDEWDKSCAEILEGNTYSLGGDFNSSKVLVRNAKDMFANVPIVKTLTNTNPKDRMSAEQIYAEMRDQIRSNWENWSRA